MKSVHHTITTFAVVVILLKSKMSSAEPSATQCRTVGGDRLKMDCIGVDLNAVPKDFDPKIKYLDLSRNKLTEITNHSFGIFPELLELIMQDELPRPIPVSSEIFKPLDKLEMLDISSTYFGFPNLVWPTRLKKLIIDGSSFNEPDLTTIQTLEVFSAKNCKMQVVPKFYGLAPLKSIDLRYNRMNDMEVKQIAPYCLVKEIFMYYGPDQRSRLNQQNNYCQCLYLERWAAQYVIKGIFPLNCTKRIEQECENNLEAEAEIRAQCLGKIGSGIPLWIFIAAGFLGFVVVVLTLSYIYHRFIRKDTGSTPSPTPTKKKRGPKTRAPRIVKDDEEDEDEEVEEDAEEDEDEGEEDEEEE